MEVPFPQPLEEVTYSMTALHFHLWNPLARAEKISWNYLMTLVYFMVYEVVVFKHLASFACSVDKFLDVVIKGQYITGSLI